VEFFVQERRCDAGVGEVVDLRDENTPRPVAVPVGVVAALIAARGRGEIEKSQTLPRREQSLEVRLLGADVVGGEAAV
jgi:hypothetical protein